MAICKDKTRNQYYISYKYKTPDQQWHSANIKNATWKINGASKVSISFMRSIELEEIEKDKSKKDYFNHENKSIPLNELITYFFQVLKSDGKDNETIYNYELAYKNYLFPIVNKETPCDMAFVISNVDKYKIALKEKGLKERTINNKMVALKNLIKFAKSRKFVSREMADDALDLLVPIKEIKHEDSLNKNNFFKNGKEDLEKFKASFEKEDKEWYVPVMLIFYGAYRISEWLALRYENIDFENDRIISCQQIDNHGKLKDKTKTGVVLNKKIPHAFMTLLKKFCEDRHFGKGDFLFIGAYGGHLSRHAVRTMINKHLKLAGLEHITLHGLRHSFATIALETHDLIEIQYQLGHSSMNTTQKYYLHMTNQTKNKKFDDML